MRSNPNLFEPSPPHIATHLKSSGDDMWIMAFWAPSTTVYLALTFNLLWRQSSWTHNRNRNPHPPSPTPSTPYLTLHSAVQHLGRTERWFQSMLSFGTDVACRLSYFIVDKLIDCAVHINTFTCCASFRPQNGALKMHEPSEPQSIVHRPSSTVHRPAIALISSEMCSDSNAF